MGRRKGSLNKSTLLKRGLLPATNVPVVDTRTDVEIVNTIRSRFDIYLDMVNGVIDRHITSLIVTGAPGVGKSHTLEWAIRHRRDANPRNPLRSHVVRGAISGIGLYEMAYAYRHAGDILVLDDADRVYYEEDSLNILKVLLDTSAHRHVSWHTDHPRFKGDDAIPKEFEFQGSMVFLTNRDLQHEIDFSQNRFTDHMKALMSRSNYLDLQMHSRREVALWTRHIVTTNRVLQAMGLSKEKERQAVDWIVEHYEMLREVSIRTALKLGQHMLTNPQKWEERARLLLLKGAK